MKWRFFAGPGCEVPPIEDGFPRGEAVRLYIDRPTVQVTRLHGEDGGRWVVKRYFFPGLGPVLRGVLRHTGLGTPKPVREARSLLRLREAGVPALEPLAWAVARNALGLVRDGWIMTPYVRGRTLDALLHNGRSGDEGWWRRLGESVAGIHRAGCWYRNLAPRNLIVDKHGEFAWFDPGKSRWQAGAVHEAHALADLLVFLAPWEDLLPVGAYAAFAQGYARWPGVQNSSELLALVPSVARSTIEAAVLRERKRRQDDSP